MKSKKISSTFLSLSLIIITIIFSGCEVNKRPTTNLTTVKKQIEQYHESGNYSKDIKKIINRAIKYFEKLSPTEKSTVIFDIDETILSNYEEQKSTSFGHIKKLIHEWILEAKAPLIPETKKLYDYLINKGFSIIFLTGRNFNEYDATIKNLAIHGIKNFEKLIVREKNELNISAKQYKSNQRKKLTKEGYKIVGCVGDQWSDFLGGNCGYRVKLPNYIYIIN